MRFKKSYTKLSIAFFLSLLISVSYAVSESNPIDNPWLPDIIGLPNKAEVEILTRHVKQVMEEEQESRCLSIDYKLRLLAFQNFVIYQHMSNAQQHYFKEKMAFKYAHVLAMILKESSGDPTNVTDMKGRSLSTSRAVSDLQRWKNLLQSIREKKITFNSQTNFGLTQLSADRLYVAFKLAHGSGHNKDFLMGKYGDATENAMDLNTAIAIRRLIWFYRDIAQGRLTQEDNPIPQEDLYKNEFNERYQTGLKMALLYCGTDLLFNKKEQADISYDDSSLEQAMASIAYCKLGNPRQGYGKHELEARCFVKWVTLCPALNLNIALITPLSYFQTRDEKPVCMDTFKRLLIKNPKETSTGN